MEITIDDLNAMQMHETLAFFTEAKTNPTTDCFTTYITRVPGGWTYTRDNGLISTSVFVPKQR